MLSSPVGRGKPHARRTGVGGRRLKPGAPRATLARWRGNFQTVDVFTDRPFGGNPLAVIVDAHGRSDGAMGRPSLLLAQPTRQGGAVARVRVGGRCVAIMEGTLLAG